MKSAMFIPYTELPRRDYDLVAMCHGPLDEILRKTNVRARKRNVKQEGGSCRVLALSLPSGRYAQVLAYDATPDSVEIFLEMVREWSAYRSDLEAVADLIAVPVKNFYWIAGAEQVRWR